MSLSSISSLLNTPRLNRANAQQSQAAASPSRATVNQGNATFGSAANALPTSLAIVDGALGFIQGERIREMLFEDIMGYGVLRSVMDYLRPVFFKQASSVTDPELKQKKQKFKGNLPAARERIIREACSIFTDVILPGVVAHRVATRWDSTYKGSLEKSLGKAMIEDETLKLFQKLGENAGSVVNSQGCFLQNMAGALAKGNQSQQQAIYSILNKAVGADKTAVTESAIKIAKLLGQKQLDVKLKGQWFALDQLLSDTQSLLKVLPHNGSPFQRALQATLKNTLKQSGYKVGIAMATGLTLTFLVPYLNAKLTERVDKLRSYPGELGLRKPVYVSNTAPDDPIGEESFSYTWREIRRGNVLPFLGALLPLAVPLGFIDTAKLSTGQFKKALINPFKTGFSKNLVRLFQFGKGWPFTSQQQVAGLYAALITSRLLNSRSDIEFRERLVDSMFLGWMVWIMGTPLLKRAFAAWSDSNGKTQLLKNINGTKILRSRLEIERLLPKAARNVTLRRFIGIGGVSTALSLLVLGIVEPLIAMQWSKLQARSKMSSLKNTDDAIKTSI